MEGGDIKIFTDKYKSVIGPRGLCRFMKYIELRGKVLKVELQGYKFHTAEFREFRQG